MDFGSQLREWRAHRRISQLALAGDAGISARHLSFLETGRSRPSEGMIIRLSEALSLPAGEQNRLFSAAGFAPRFKAAKGRDPQALPEVIGATLKLILDRHAPWPAIAFDADHEMVMANAGFAAMAGALGIDTARETNVLALVLENEALREAVSNWPEVAGFFLRRARNEAWLYGPRSPLARRLARYENDPKIALLMAAEGARNPPPVITVRLMLGGRETEWITTLTAFGAAQEVVSQGIFIEQYFPANAETKALADRLGEPRP